MVNFHLALLPLRPIDIEMLSPLIYATMAIFGAMVGSFLNVCIYRFPKEHMSIVSPGSHCTQCGKMIRWFDNIPIISWMCLFGSCRNCRYPISFRYTLVELITSLLFLFYTHQMLIEPSIAIFAKMSIGHRWIALFIVCYLCAVMVATTFIDIDYRIIPLQLTHPGILLAPIVSALFPYLHRPISSEIISNPHTAGFLASILGMIVGGGSLYVIGVVGKIIFRKEAMGQGDVNLMVMVGGFLGWDSALLIFFVACMIGTVFGIFTMIVTKDHYIPFGPYLAIGTLITVLYKSSILNLVFVTWPIMMSKWLYLPMIQGY